MTHAHDCQANNPDFVVVGAAIEGSMRYTESARANRYILGRRHSENGECRNGHAPTRVVRPGDGGKGKCPLCGYTVYLFCDNCGRPIA